LSTRPPCARQSCVQHRESSSAAPGRCCESRAQALPHSCPTKFSAPATAPHRKPKATSQKNVFLAKKENHTAPEHLRAHAYESAASLRYADHPGLRRSREEPTR